MIPLLTASIRIFDGVGPHRSGMVLGGAVSAVLGLGLGLLLAPTRRWWPATAASLAYAGAAWEPIAPAVPSDAWLRLALVPAAVAVGCLTWAEASIARSTRRPEWFVPALLVATLVGVYGAVPDTEAALWALGAATVTLVASALLPAPAAPAWGALAGLVVWAAAVGADGRPRSFIGICACFGVLVAEPVAVGAVRLVRSRFDPDRAVRPLRWWPVLLPLQVAAVALGSRVWGLGTSKREIGIGVLATLAVVTIGIAASTAVSDGRRTRARTPE